MRKLLDRYTCSAGKLKDTVLLLLRLALAYGFLKPALMKAKDIDGIATWFTSLHIPFPLLSACLSAGTEILGVVLLASGLFVRIISIPLIIVMIVAIAAVHWGNGFEAGNNGFEIPLYYALMLSTLVASGAGKFSLDWLLFGKRYRRNEQHLSCPQKCQ